MLTTARNKELDYLNSLKAGETVIETGNSGISGEIGVTVDKGKKFGMCVKWENGTTTSITHGTKRLSDAQKVTLIKKGTTKAIFCYECGPYTFRPIDRSARIHISEVSVMFQKYGRNRMKG